MASRPKAYLLGMIVRRRRLRESVSLSALATRLGGWILPTLASGVAVADEFGLRMTTGSLLGKLDGARLDLNGPMGLLFVGLTIFSTTMAVLHVRARKLWNDQFETQRATIAGLQAASARSSLFLGAEKQVFIGWDGPDGEPEVEGDSQFLASEATPRSILNFNTWVVPEQAHELATAVEKLRNRGEAFSQMVRTMAGAYVEVEGQPVVGRAVMRIRCVTGARMESAKLNEKISNLSNLVDAMKFVLDTIPHPMWLRHADGSVAWANNAYIHAVEANDLEAVRQRAVEFLERPTRDAIAASHQRGEAYHGATQAVVAGDRRMLEVIDVLAPVGSGGIATDITELETARRGLNQMNEAHARTLDQLPTAVALFDKSQRLYFQNRAFSELWQLDQGFLASGPTDMELLDRLRGDGKLPEQSDFQEWKQGLQQSFHANENFEDIWLLPSGRSLRVVASPNLDGGSSYLFEDITEQTQLAARYNRLANMQGETLDALVEGVAVFGSNGRLQLFNPAFASLWGLSSSTLAGNPHIDAVARLCPKETVEVWREISAAVCGLPDERVNRTFEIRTAKNRTFTIGVSPLPDGASLLTLEDVTSAANAALMLRERNQALEAAARFRSEFIHNISFELRLPLTSVVGIAQLLATGTGGPLNDKQRGYANDLMKATDSVLALINDILDLASIDSSNLDLNYAEIDVVRLIEEATGGLKERLGEAGVRLSIRIAKDIGTFVGDSRRIRQILFNLIANAVAFSDPGDMVNLTVERGQQNIVLRIADRGPGAGLDSMAGGENEQRRYERGPSLRLSIVRSLIELHQGRLLVEGRADGTRLVTCVLPAAAPRAQQVAS